MKHAVLSPAAWSRTRWIIARRTSAWVPVRKTRPEGRRYLSSSEMGSADIRAPEEPRIIRAATSEKACLSREGGRHEPRAVEVRRGLVEAEALDRFPEALREELGEFALPHHARAEIGVVLAAFAHVPHTRHHVLGLEREVLLEPLLEDR